MNNEANKKMAVVMPPVVDTAPPPVSLTRLPPHLSLSSKTDSELIASQPDSDQLPPDMTKAAEIDWDALTVNERMEASSKIHAARVARLQRAHEVLLGVRTKVRLPTLLCERVLRVASAFEVGLSEFVCAACRGMQAGKFRVPTDEKIPVGTRNGSLTVWVRVPETFDASALNLRQAILAAVVHYESALEEIAAREKAFPPEALPVEGVDYLVAGRAYTRRVEGRVLV